MQRPFCLGIGRSNMQVVLTGRSSRQTPLPNPQRPAVLGT
jgi:hypothetical protein